MPLPISDALVSLGATADLALQANFPALQGLVRDEGLNIPIIGCQAGWSLDQLKGVPRTAFQVMSASIPKPLRNSPVYSAMSM